MADSIRIPITVAPEGAILGFKQAGDAAKKFAQDVKHSLAEAQNSLQGMNKGLQTMQRDFSALASLRAGPVGLALTIALSAKRAAASTVSVSKSIVELAHASKELGMSERDIRAWGYAAERVGISSQTMVQNLQKFSDVSNGLRYNVGGVRNELIRMGAGPVVRQLMVATNQAERLRIAFQMKDTLMREDPSGFKARMWMDQIGLGANSARLSLEQYERTQARIAKRTDEEVKRSEAVQDAVSNLAITWDRVTDKLSVALLPWLDDKIQALEKLVELLAKGGEAKPLEKMFPGPGGGAIRPPRGFRPGPAPAPGVDQGPGMHIPQFQHGGFTGAGGLAMLHANELVVPLGAGKDILEGSEPTLERSAEEGTFRALLRFASYQRAAAGGGLGSNLGAMGGGGVGGSSSSGGSSSTGGSQGDRPAGSSVTPSADELMAKGQFPGGMQPMYPTSAPASWAGIKGMDSLPAEVTGDMGGGLGPGTGGLGIRAGEAAGAGGGSLAERRASLAAELEKDPKLKQDLWDLTQAEVGGQGAQSQQAFMETVFNRALSPQRGGGGIGALRREIHNKKYYAHTKGVGAGRGKPAEEALKGVVGGSDLTRGATGNASGTVGFGRKGITTLNLGKGERYGIEEVDRDAIAAFNKDKTGAPKAAQDNRGDQKPPPPQTQTTPQRGGGPSFRTDKNAEVQRFVGFQNAVKNMTPEMQARVMSAYRAMPPDVQKSFVMNEGWRTRDYQAHLKRTQGGRGMVATPGQSRHEFGEAMDVDKGLARDWLRAYGYQHGLEPLKGDLPHFQLRRGDARRFAEGGERIPIPGQEAPAVAGDYPTKPKFGLGGRTGGGGIGSDTAIDAANGAGRRPSEVSVTVNGKGKGSGGDDKPKPEFADTQVKQSKQMQMTESSQAGITP